jgi:pyruvate/2-oxoglutarate dehydrogenase complex dihydrolipoamide acyltransferase (E2) component
MSTASNHEEAIQNAVFDGVFKLVPVAGRWVRRAALDDVGSPVTPATPRPAPEAPAPAAPPPAPEAPPPASKPAPQPPSPAAPPQRALPAPKSNRLARDATIQSDHPNPPPANNGQGKIGTSAKQAAQLADDITWARALGATDIRVNQQQVNAAGVRVGLNRPDLQFTIELPFSGRKVRYYVEYDAPSGAAYGSERGAAHAERILANDPAGKVIQRIIP